MNQVEQSAHLYGHSKKSSQGGKDNFIGLHYTWIPNWLVDFDRVVTRKIQDQSKDLRADVSQMNKSNLSARASVKSLAQGICASNNISECRHAV